MREFVRPMQEGVQVLVWPARGRRADAPIAGLLSTFGSDVAIAGAGVVNPHPIM
jgi:hypothetical protein